MGEGTGNVSLEVQLEGIRGDIRLILELCGSNKEDYKELKERVQGHSSRFQIIDGRFAGIDSKFAEQGGYIKGLSASFKLMYILWGVLGGGGVCTAILVAVLKAKGIL